MHTRLISLFLTTFYLLAILNVPARGQVTIAAAEKESDSSATEKNSAPAITDRMTPELLWKLGRLGDATVSADGNLVALRSEIL